MKRAIVLASGGLDSSTVVLKLVKDGYEVHPVFVDYGQRAERQEWRACKAICDHMMTLEPVRFDVSSVGQIHERLASQSKRQVYFPFRNPIFACLGALYAYDMCIDSMALGLIKDPRPLPDCTETFRTSLEGFLKESSRYELTVLAPFIDKEKYEVVRYGMDNGLPYGLTYSCYEGDERHCGKCAACRSRKTAFRKAGCSDPTDYNE